MTSKTLDILIEPLKDIGFKKRAGYIFTTELAPNVLGWIGLNRATQGRGRGEVAVSPVIGVRFQEVEKVVAECIGKKFHSYVPPSISSPIGYQMPQNRYATWEFYPDGSDDSAVDMLNAIATHGLNFIRSVTTLSELQEHYRNDSMTMPEMIAKRRAVVAFLLGESEQAHGLLHAELDKHKTSDKPYAVEYRLYAEALRKRFSED